VSLLSFTQHMDLMAVLVIFYKHAVIFNGKTRPTSEHAYQAQKFIDTEYR
jgi:predicted NAD-dependent protein-ADP-ribosyltransferase YbiA (DUF1768 family)